MRQLGQYAAPRHAIAHLSDPHLIGGGGLHYGVVDNIASLRRALETIPLDQARQLASSKKSPFNS